MDGQLAVVLVNLCASSAQPEQAKTISSGEGSCKFANAKINTADNYIIFDEIQNQIER